MPTQTQPWLRAELIAAPETSPGAQLMIPADGVEFHDDQLVFHHQGDIVYVASQGQLRSITWFARQPNPETARRKAQWPKHGTRWTDEERADLLRHLRTGHSWKAISHAHGRSRTGCQQEAIKQGWLDPDTLQPTAALLLAEPTPEPDAKTEPLLATPSTESTASAPAPDATLADAAPDSPPKPAATPAIADQLREATLTNAAADSPPKVAAPTSSPPTPWPALSPDPASPLPKAPIANSAAGPPPTSWPVTTPQPSASVPASASPSPSATSSATAKDAVDTSAAPPIAPEPLASATAAPPPDRPRIPPRVPRQRTGPDAEARPGAADPDKDSDPGSAPGSRFLSRAQSSLARATLGAYMNPPRGQSGAASGAT